MSIVSPLICRGASTISVGLRDSIARMDLCHNSFVKSGKCCLYFVVGCLEGNGGGY